MIVYGKVHVHISTSMYIPIRIHKVRRQKLGSDFKEKVEAKIINLAGILITYSSGLFVFPKEKHIPGPIAVA